MKILIIAGHQNIKYNSITSLHGNTGTAGELEINVRIANRVSSMLRDRKIEVVQSDANVNDDKNIRKTDFSLALALHCDMDVVNDKGGGMCGSGDKSVDASWQESLRIKNVFDEVYFKESQIVNKKIVTQGMAKYYVWQYLSSKTPCVLLEMGQAKDPHDSILLSNTELIASSIVRSICKALNVDYEISCNNIQNKIEEENKSLKIENEKLKASIISLEINFKNQLEDQKIKFNNIKEKIKSILAL